MKSISIMIPGVFLSTLLALPLQTNASTPRICMSGNTSIYYATDKSCLQVSRSAEEGTEFQLTGHLIKAETNTLKRPTLVIIPGGPGDSGADLFLSLEKRSLPGGLHKHLNLNTLYYDPRGTGASEIPGDFKRLSNKTFSTKNNVDDLKALLDYAGIKDNVILLSHSAGGAIALKFAELYPEYLNGLILYSSVDTLKETGNHIRAFEGDEMWMIIDEALQSHTGIKHPNQVKQFQKIEDAVINEKLLLVHDALKTPELSRTSVFGFRHLALKWALESPERFQEFLDAHQERLDIHSSQPLADTILPEQLFSKRWFQASWLKATMFCSEALSTDDLEKPFVYPGLTLEYLCKDITTFPAIDNTVDLSSIKTRTLVLAGKMDTQVMWMSQKQISDQLSNSRFQLIDGAGHNFHSSHPIDFYKAVEGFVNSSDIIAGTRN